MLADDASSDNNRCDEAQEARARATKAQGESESGRDVREGKLVNLRSRLWRVKQQGEGDN